MSDNKLLPASGAGSVITVATDEIAGVDFQKVKLVDGAADSTALIGGDATNGLDVDVTRVIPGTSATHLGKAEDAAHGSGDTGVMALGVRADTLASTAANGDYVPVLTDSLGALYTVGEERLVTVTVSPTVTNGAYSAGDVVGGLMTFANAARFSGGPITVESVVIMSKTPALNNSLELWLFSASVSVASDNAAVSYSDADAALCIGVLPCGPWADSALNSISTRSGIGLAATLAGTSLYGQLVTRNGPTLTSTSDIAVSLVIRQG